MAGSPATISTHNLEMEILTHNSQYSAFIDEWEIQYARFINYSSTTVSRTHPSLTPISAVMKKRCGTWISTTSSSVSLKLIFERTGTGLDDVVLVLTLGSRVLEEHRISKIYFSWPQVSCVSGFPARGSRAVFVSFKDGVGQIQKFAMHFLTIFETEKFMNVLKEIFETGTPRQLQCPEFNSELSSQAEVVPYDGPTYRSEEDWQSTASADTSTHPMPPLIEFNAAQETIAPEMIQNCEAAETLSSFPPSFTQLLKNCHPAVDEAKPKESDEDLKTQFMRYLEGTSFKELLATVENVINELGDDIVL